MLDGQAPHRLLSAAFDVLANVPLPPPDLRHAFVEKLADWIQNSALPLCREIDAARRAPSGAARPCPGCGTPLRPRQEVCSHRCRMRRSRARQREQRPVTTQVATS
jgi:hypothetical protein